MFNLYEVSIIFKDGSMHVGHWVAQNALTARAYAIEQYEYFHSHWAHKLMCGTITRVINYDL